MVFKTFQGALTQYPVASRPAREPEIAANHNDAKAKRAMAKRTTIEIYTRQKTSFSPVYGSSVHRCAQCDARVLMLTPECTADALQVTARTIAELIDSQVLHGATASAGRFLICSNSVLFASTNSEPEPRRKTL